MSRHSSRNRPKKQGVQDGASEVTMEMDIPGDMVRDIFGRSESIQKQLESSTGAKICIERPKTKGQKSVVAATGTQQQVQSALEKVKAEVAKRSQAMAEELEPRFKGLPSPGNTQSGNQDDGSKWSYEEMEADITISASPLTFKALVGKKGENVKKIREECDANIEIEDQRKVKEFQHAYISGIVNEAIRGSRMVKESLESYDPELDHSKKEGSVNKVDLKSIKAKAKCKIIGKAVGFLIGKGGSNLERMKQETNYEDFVYDKEEEEGGLATVRLSGYVGPVLDALYQVYLSTKWWCEKQDGRNSQPDATEKQQNMTPHTATDAEMATAEMSALTLEKRSSSLPVYSQGVEPPSEPVYVFKDRNGYVVEFQQLDGDVYKRVVHKPQQLDLGLPPGFAMSDCLEQQGTPMSDEATGVAPHSPSPASHQSRGSQQRRSSRRSKKRGT